MTNQTIERGAGEVPARSASFELFAGVGAIVAGVSGFLYGVAFIVLQNILLSSLFLMLGGLLTSAVLTAVYNRLRETDAEFALWALLLGIAGALGSVIHGGYDLANAVNPLVTVPPDLPNPVDPRGLLTFGAAGLALFVIAWLVVRSGEFPRGLGYLAFIAAVLLVVLYLGRLIVLDPTSPLIAVPALLSGFLVNPALYIWLGLAFLRSRRS